MLDYYYPGTSHNRVVGTHEIYPVDTAVYYWQEEKPAISDIKDADFGSEFWLFWETNLTDEELQTVEDAGYDIEFIYEGNMSSYYIYIYHLTMK